MFSWLINHFYFSQSTFQKKEKSKDKEKTENYFKVFRTEDFTVSQ